ncbi:MAG TPA: hypothetical protein VFA65_11365 [Bryobacteraceae bacterium]|nr:hypothetical protein [Bryobacteraceae bacterium]
MVRLSTPQFVTQMRSVAEDPGQTWLTTWPAERGIQHGGGILHPQLCMEGICIFIEERFKEGKADHKLLDDAALEKELSKSTPN